MLAIFTALSLTDSTAVHSVLGQLAKTERNFILKKGETTVDLERERFERQQVMNILEQFSKTLGGLRSKESK